MPGARQLVIGLWDVAVDDLLIFDIDAHTWTTVNASPGAGAEGPLATDGEGTYVYFPSSPGVVSTDDGATWNPIPQVMGVDVAALGVVWDRVTRLFRTVSYGSQTWTSPDGVTWTQSTTGPIPGVGIANLLTIDGVLWTQSLAVSMSDFRTDRIWKRHPPNGVWFDTLDATNIFPAGSLQPARSVTSHYNSFSDRLPRTMATNRQIVVFTCSAGATAMWADYTPIPPADGDIATPNAATFSGVGTSLQSAVAHPTDGYWIGGGDDTWLHSADGKAWVGVADASMTDWTLVDALFDGEFFWFAGTKNAAPFDVAAVFRCDPGSDYTTSTWTRFDAPGTPGAGARMMTGYPSYWDLEPPVADLAVVDVEALPAQPPMFADLAVVNVEALDAHQVADLAVVDVEALPARRLYTVQVITEEVFDWRGPILSIDLGVALVAGDVIVVHAYPNGQTPTSGVLFVNDLPRPALTFESGGLGVPLAWHGWVAVAETGDRYLRINWSGLSPDSMAAVWTLRGERAIGPYTPAASVSLGTSNPETPEFDSVDDGIALATLARAGSDSGDVVSPWRLDTSLSHQDLAVRAMSRLITAGPVPTTEFDGELDSWQIVVQPFYAVHLAPGSARGFVVPSGIAQPRLHPPTPVPGVIPRPEGDGWPAAPDPSPIVVPTTAHRDGRYPT